jgi:hypothetical protein
LCFSNWDTLREFNPSLTINLTEPSAYEYFLVVEVADGARPIANVSSLAHNKITSGARADRINMSITLLIAKIVGIIYIAAMMRNLNEQGIIEPFYTVLPHA